MSSLLRLSLPTQSAFKSCNAVFQPRSLNRVSNARSFSRSFATEEVKVPTHLLKELRAQTLAGYSDCKAALAAEGNDIVKATEWLKKKGILKAAKKADRIAADGVLGMLINPERTQGVITELNCETDFVSRGDSFSKLSGDTTQAAHQLAAGRAAGAHDLLNDLTAQKSVSEGIVDTISKLGENIRLRRAHCLTSTPGGVIGGYMHRVQDSEKVKPVTLGKIASLVSLKCEGSAAGSEKARDLANKLAVHVVGFNPQFLNPEEVTEQDYENFKAAFMKKQEDKLADKQMKFSRTKSLEDVVLLEQEFSLHGTKKVREVLADLSKELGGRVTIERFIKVNCGEGIEKKEEDFAKEVERMMKQ